MILGMQIALLIMGLFALVTGKMTLGKNRVVHGGAARMLGVIALLPLPLAVGAGVVVTAVLGPNWLSRTDQTINWIGIAVELGSIVFCVAVIYGLGALVAGPAHAGAPLPESEQDAFRRMFPERFGSEPPTDGAVQGPAQLRTMSLLNDPALLPAEQVAPQPQKQKTGMRPLHFVILFVMIGAIVVGRVTNEQLAKSVSPVEQATQGDGVCHLHLTVPENAEVYVDGARTSAKGAHREFVSPPLQPGTKSSYKVAIRYTNVQGKSVDDTRDVVVRPNDVVRIDFTPAAPPK